MQKEVGTPSQGVQAPPEAGKDEEMGPPEGMKPCPPLAFNPRGKDLRNQKRVNLCCLKPLCPWFAVTTIAGLSTGPQVLTGRGGIRNQSLRAACGLKALDLLGYGLEV